MTRATAPVAPPTIPCLVPRLETLEFDEVVLARLCARHGTGAEAALATHLREVEEGLALAAQQLRHDSRGGLLRTCADLRALASDIGLRTLDRIAAAVLDSARSGDPAAFAACAARLVALARPDALRNWTVLGGTVA